MLPDEPPKANDSFGDGFGKAAAAAFWAATIKHVAFCAMIASCFWAMASCEMREAELNAQRHHQPEEDQ